VALDFRRFDCACGGLAQQMLELGEDLLDRVQVWRVFRQEKERPLTLFISLKIHPCELLMAS
jgi:hypothetical protein